MAERAGRRRCREARLTAPARALARYVARYRVRYAAGFATLIVATLAALAIPWTVKRAIEALETNAASAPLGGFVAVIVMLALLNAAARLGSRFAIIGGAQRVEADLRLDLYAALQRFPPAYFADHSTGDLMARASGDLTAVRGIVGFGGVSLVSTVVAFVGAIVAMLAVDPWLTLYAIAPYPVLIVLARRFNASMHERTEAVQAELGRLSARVQEHLVGMSVVRAYAMEPAALRAFGEANASYRERSLGLARLQAQFGPLMTLIGGIGTLVVLWLGGGAVADGRISLGSLVAFNGYLAYLAWPTLALGWTLAVVRRGLTSMGRIHEVLEAAPPDESETAAPTDLAGSVPPSIAFRHLSFRYPGREPALIDVTFDVRPGETVAVVGPTGTGKSTLGVLLTRLWDPPAGTVFLGGRDVITLPRGALRRAVGYVPQESFLFSRSILDNVTLGREGLGRAEAEAAARTAGVATEIAAFPEGFDAVVGERGLTVSGGQRQRIALARAVVGQPPALVLDDVFANVDFAKEEEIVGQLRRALADRTVLLMTHRLRAARAADRIVVIDGGRVTESGTHDELIARGGLYARLWRIQQLEEEITRAS